MVGIKLLCVSFWLYCACSATTASAQDLSTPEAAVRSFINAYCHFDFKAGSACVENAKYDTAFDKLDPKLMRTPMTYSLKDVQVVPEDDKAIVTVQVTIKEDRDAKPKTFPCTLKLHRTEGSWHIVADQAASLNLVLPDEVRLFADCLASPTDMAVVLGQARERERTMACLQNVRDLALASLMLCADYDEVFALKEDNYKKAILPYLQHKGAFHCPDDKEGVVSYRFNTYLAGVHLAAIKDPAKLVMIYEGKSCTLDFKHKGYASVAFVDGHCRIFNEVEAKKLVWKP